MPDTTGKAVAAAFRRHVRRAAALISSTPPPPRFSRLRSSRGRMRPPTRSLLLAAVLAVVVLLPALFSDAAQAQETPTVSLALSPSGTVDLGTEIAVTMSFGGLEEDSDPSDVDYIFRADVLDSDGAAADGCEDRAGGFGLGVDRYMRLVDQDPEVRNGTVSADCPAGDYTLVAAIADGENNRLASASAAFTIAAPPSDDATLRRLELSGIPFDFDPAVYEYDLNVAHKVGETTLTAETSHAAATYAEAVLAAGYEDGVATLAEGANTITIEVTAEDGETALTYTVNVTRAAAPDPEPVAARQQAVNSVTVGWNADTNMAHVSWTDGQTCAATARYYVYVLPSSPPVEIPLGNVAVTESSFLANQVTTVDDFTIRVYCGERNTGRLLAAVLVDFDRSGTYPLSDDATLSALTVSEGTLHGFPGSTPFVVGVANSVTSIDVTATVNHSGATIDVDGNAASSGNPHTVSSLAVGRNTVNVYVTAESEGARGIYTIHVERGANADYRWKASDDLNGLYAASNNDPEGIWSNGTTIWVADPADDKLYAYAQSDGTRQDGTGGTTNLEFDLHAANANARGIWSDGTTIWVADTGDDKLYAYKFTPGSDFGDRDSGKDINTLGAAGNTAPEGIWSDGATMWVADTGDDKLYAYALSGGTRQTNMEFSLHADNADARGIWSDETIMWVSDFNDKKLYAYALSDGTRNSGREFNTLDAAGNDAPNDIWSDGTTMWAVNDGANESDKVFSYYMPSPPSIVRGYIDGGNIMARWKDNDRGGCGGNNYKAYFSSVTTSFSGEYLDNVNPNYTPTNGALVVPPGWGGRVITFFNVRFAFDVEVWCGARNSGRKLGEVHAPHGQGRLGNVALSGATLTPDFNQHLHDYDATVPAGTASTTVTYGGKHSAATVSYLDSEGSALADADGNTAGFQVALGAGETVFSVRISNGNFGRSTYNFTVTKQLPTLSIADARGPEGGDVEFTVTLSAASDETVSVDYATSVGGGDTATEDTDYTAASGTLSFNAGERSKTITVQTASDSVSEGAETFTVTLSDPSHATISDATATGTITPPPLPNMWLSPAASDPAASVRSEATYSVTFQGDWTTTVTADGVPSGAHFTTLIGGVHNADATFLREGGMASAGVESMAELGGTSTLAAEVGAEPNALSVLQGSGGTIGPTGSSTINVVTLTTDHPRVTLLTMVAPSPDWFVGVSGLSLLDAQGDWLASRTVNLYPWDAGTEEGTEFTLSNAATSPQETITSLRGIGKFSNERIATLTFTRQSVNAAPSFTSDATFSVVENTTEVGTVEAEDRDTGDEITGYSINATTGGADRAQFEITDEGVLTFKTAPDYENPADVDSTNPANDDGNNEYIVEVTAASGAGDRAMTATQTITVTVTNEDPPATMVTVTVPSTPVEESDGTVTVTVTATTERDEAFSAGYTFRVSVSTRGETASALTDYGSLSEFVVFAQTDFTRGGSPPVWTAVKTYAVTLTDDTDEEPAETFKLVLERGPGLDPAISLDPDDKVVTIAKSDTAAPELAADPDGVVVDGATLTLTYNEDLDEDPVGTPPTTAYTLGGTTATVTAVAVSGRTVTLTLSQAVGGADTVTLTYTAPAAVPGTSGPVRDLIGEQAADIPSKTATNRTNNPPSFTSGATFSVVENTTEVGTVAAEDTDTGDAITGYSIDAATGGADRAQFEITDEGVLTFKTAPDYENPTDVASTNPGNNPGNNEYVVTVTATSGTGARAMTATQTITVTVTDVTSVTDATYCANTILCGTLTVGEKGTDATGYASDFGVGTLTDTSFDLGGSSRTVDAIVQWLTGGDAGQLQLQLSPSFASATAGNGLTLHVGSTALPLSGATYSVTGGESFYSWSGHGVSWSSGDEVTVKITRANVPPSFTSDATFSVVENNTEVGTVAAEDTDTGDAITGYSIDATTGGADRAKFEIDAVTGVLTFVAAPDFEAPTDVQSTNPSNQPGNNEYVVRVTAASGAGDRAMTAVQTITVTVTNEDPPATMVTLTVPADPVHESVGTFNVTVTATTERDEEFSTGYTFGPTLSTRSETAAGGGRLLGVITASGLYAGRLHPRGLAAGLERDQDGRGHGDRRHGRGAG